MSATGRNLVENPTNALGAYDTPPGLCLAVVDRLEEERVLYPFTDLCVLEPSVGSGNMIQALKARGWLEHVHLEAMDLDPMAPGLDLAVAVGGLANRCAPHHHDPTAMALTTAALDAAGVPRHRQGLAAAGFLTTASQRGRVDLVLGNPPYSVTAPPVPCPDCGQTGMIPGARKPRRCPACNAWKEGKRPPELPEGHQPARLISTADLHVHRALDITSRHVVFVMRLPFLGGQERFRDLWRSRPYLRAVWTVVGRPSFVHGGTDNVETAVYWWDLEWTKPTFEGGWLTWENAR